MRKNEIRCDVQHFNLLLKFSLKRKSYVRSMHFSVDKTDLFLQKDSRITMMLFHNIIYSCVMKFKLVIKLLFFFKSIRSRKIIINLIQHQFLQKYIKTYF